MTAFRLAALGFAAALCAGSAEAASCAAEVGPREAASLVARCTEISPATHPPCNARNSCELIRSEIRRGCAFAGSDAPDWCETDDEDED